MTPQEIDRVFTELAREVDRPKIDHKIADKVFGFQDSTDWNLRFDTKCEFLDVVGTRHVTNWAKISELLDVGARAFLDVCVVAESFALREWQSIETPECFLWTVKNEGIRAVGSTSSHAHHFWEVHKPRTAANATAARDPSRMLLPACGPLTASQMTPYFADACASEEGLATAVRALTDASHDGVFSVVERQFKAHKAMLEASEAFFEAFLMLRTPLSQVSPGGDLFRVLLLAAAMPTHSSGRLNEAVWKLTILSLLLRFLDTQRALEAWDKSRVKKKKMHGCVGTLHTGFEKLYHFIQRECLIRLGSRVQSITKESIAAASKQLAEEREEQGEVGEAGDAGEEGEAGEVAGATAVVGVKRTAWGAFGVHGWQPRQVKTGKNTSNLTRARVSLADDFAARPSLVMVESSDLERRTAARETFRKIETFLRKPGADVHGDDPLAWAHASSAVATATRIAEVRQLLGELKKSAAFTDELLGAYAARLDGTFAEDDVAFLKRASGKSASTAVSQQLVDRWFGDVSKLTYSAKSTARTKKQLAQLVGFFEEHLAVLCAQERRGVARVLDMPPASTILKTVREFAAARRAPENHSRSKVIELGLVQEAMKRSRNTLADADAWRTMICRHFVLAFWKAAEWAELTCADPLGELGFLPGLLSYEEQTAVLSSCFIFHGVPAGDTNRATYRQFGVSYLFCLFSIAARAGAIRSTTDAAEHAAFAAGTAEACRTCVFSFLNDGNTRHVAVSPLNTPASLEFVRTRWEACARSLFSQIALCVRLAVHVEVWDETTLPMFDASLDSIVRFSEDRDDEFLHVAPVSARAAARLDAIDQDAKRYLPPRFDWQFQDMVNGSADSEDFLATADRLKLLTLYLPNIVAGDDKGIFKVSGVLLRRDRRSIFAEFEKYTREHDYYIKNGQNTAVLADKRTEPEIPEPDRDDAVGAHRADFELGSDDESRDGKA